MLVEISLADVVLPSDFAFILQNFSRQNVDKRGFSRAVQADDSHVFSVVDLQIRIVKENLVVVAMGQPFDFEYAHSVLPFPGK